MVTQQHIEQVFTELKGRYDRISLSTIKDLLSGRKSLNPGQIMLATAGDGEGTPSLVEVQTAFLNHTCIVITAFRGGHTLEQNLARNARLKADMDALGLQYRPVMGCYREADWEYASIEYCYFVTDQGQRDTLQFFARIYRLSEKYDQDSFLYKRGGINRTAFLVASTDAGRADLKRDIRFAGQLFLRVPDVEAWTDASDGRFAFQLRGMILTGTPDPKIKLGEGSLFDTESYGATGLAVLRCADQDDLGHACKSYDGKPPLVQHVFKSTPSPERLHDVIFRCLKQLRDQRCKKIGFLCTATVNGSSVEGARSAYEAVQSWAQRYNKKFTQIVIVDTYGDYAKALNQQNQ